MLIYRIGPKALAKNFSGLGRSYKHGARWNRKGLPALYFGCSPAVAMLELANYLASPRLVPASYRLGIYELPDDIPCNTLTLRDMPSDWQQYPYPGSTQSIGSEWLLSQASVLLFLPSTAVPGGLENIALFNPQHPDAKAIKLVESEKQIYSPRMFGGSEE